MGDVSALRDMEKSAALVAVPKRTVVLFFPGYELRGKVVRGSGVKEN